MDMTKARNAARATLAAAALLTTVGPVQASNASYVFTAIDTARHGLDVVNGHYDQAIARIRAGSADETNFSESTSLCIAYTKLGDVNGAMAYCDRAVAIARRTNGMRRVADMPAMYGKDLDLVIALSNRGVAHAASGNHAMALADLQEADALRPRLSALPKNLEILAEAMASAE